jgi:hypothetical protein
VIVPFPPTFFENQTVKSALQAIPVLVHIYLAVELFQRPKKQKNGCDHCGEGRLDDVAESLNHGISSSNQPSNITEGVFR